MEKYKKHYLDFNLAFAYMKDMLTHSNRLSHFILQNSCFNSGNFYTILPHNANLESLYLFKNGGIIPQDREKKLIDFYGSNVYFQETISTRESMNEYVFNYLKNNNEGTVVIEEVILDKNDDFSNIKNVFLAYTENQVYYVLKSRNSVDEITECLLNAEQIWHFVVILIPFNVELSEKLTDAQMELLASSMQSMIVTAYDGESYIFWEKA